MKSDKKHDKSKLPQIPERITNYSRPKPYKPPKWESARPGADDHRRYRSRGV